MSVSGVILAGGKSSRMNFNKAFAEIAGKPIVEVIIAKFTRFFPETIIISNEPEAYQSYGLKVYPDVYPQLGPISGIHSALYNSSTDVVFVLGCDIPFIKMELVKLMLQKLGGHDAVVPKVGAFLQPISAVYSKKCLPVFTDCLENQKLKLTLVFKELDTVILPEAEIKQFGNLEEIFFNVNNSEALGIARKMAGRLL